MKNRLIELFGGIGSQAKALTNIKVPYEHYRLVEFDKYAVQSYNAIHGTNFIPQDITKTTVKDLNIVDTDNYNYIMTYSFPCQDLSLAGNQKGMAKGTSTRSGLLWEVERILKECNELPQVLLMENVTQVHGTANKQHFEQWQVFLESLGYSNYYKDLNAKNYGIPQNRDRCFMVSLLSNRMFTFPKGIELKLRLKDMLENEVDEKYYLSDKVTNNIKYSEYSLKKIKANIDKIDNSMCGTITANAMQSINHDSCQMVKVADLNIPGRHESACRVYSPNGITPTCNTCQGGGLETKIIEPSGWNYNETLAFQKKPLQGLARTLKSEKHDDCAIMEDYRIRKLTPKECWRLMGFSDEDFEKAKASGMSNSQLYKQAGNSIVVNVLEEIFKAIFDCLENGKEIQKIQQLTLF